jgi:hypothetical protein
MSMGADGRGPGSAYLVRGGTLGGAASIRTADAIIQGEAPADSVGHSVSGGGDIDGDGHVDLLISASANDRAGDGAGLVAIFYGPVSGSFTVADADALLLGEAAGDDAGATATPAGDTDGDGAEDLLVSGSFHSGYAEHGGVVWLIRGGPR